MRIMRFNETSDNDPYNEEIDSDEISFNDISRMFDDLNILPLRKYEPIEFLKSLKLSKEQYDKLRTIIEEYGFERYSGGYDTGYLNGNESNNDRW